MLWKKCKNSPVILSGWSKDFDLWNTFLLVHVLDRNYTWNNHFAHQAVLVFFSCPVLTNSCYTFSWNNTTIWLWFSQTRMLLDSKLHDEKALWPFILILKLKTEICHRARVQSRFLNFDCPFPRNPNIEIPRVPRSFKRHENN